MSAFWAIAKREYASMFRLPLGWVVIALFLFLSGLFFSRSSITPGEPATMREFFSLWWSLLLVVAPAVSMRLLSEEFRTGTVESLLTAPADEAAIAAGKFAAAAAFLLTALLPTGVYVGLLFALARPDFGPIFTGYLGVLLLGGYYLAVGTLISSLTSSQTLAFLATMFALLLTEVGAGMLGAIAPAPLDRFLLGVSANNRLVDFARGLIDTSHVVFFLAIIAWCLAMTAVSLKVRRWQ